VRWGGELGEVSVSDRQGCGGIEGGGGGRALRGGRWGERSMGGGGG